MVSKNKGYFNYDQDHKRNERTNKKHKLINLKVMRELYERIYIKSEADLPKEEGEYHVKKKDSFRLTTMIFKPNHDNYIKDWLFDYEVEWYFMPYISF